MCVINLFCPRPGIDDTRLLHRRARCPRARRRLGVQADPVLGRRLLRQQGLLRRVVLARSAEESSSGRTARASGTRTRSRSPVASPSRSPDRPTNSIFAVSYFPADERILYSVDQGGNELAHLYVRTPTARSRTSRRARSSRRTSSAGPATTSRSSSPPTSATSASSTCTRCRPTATRRTLFYKNTDGYNIGAVSRDKRYLALVKTYTTSDQDIFLYDLQKSTTTNITEAHRATVNNSPADFSPDGTKLLFVSDSGREFASLRSYDLATARRSRCYEQNWDVAGAELLEERQVPRSSGERGREARAARARREDAAAGDARRACRRAWSRGVRALARRLADRVLRQRRQRARRPLRRPARRGRRSA